jgi:hypothetical protein
MGARKESLVGPPHGSIASPIIANVSLHELDEFVERLRKKREKGQVKARNPHDHIPSEKQRKMGRQGRTKTREFRELTAHMRTLPSVVVNDPPSIRLRRRPDHSTGYSEQSSESKSLSVEAAMEKSTEANTTR